MSDLTSTAFIDIFSMRHKGVFHERNSSLKVLLKYTYRVFFYWSRPKSSKYGTGPNQGKKMTGSAQHIEKKIQGADLY